MSSRLGLSELAGQMNANAAKWQVGEGEMYQAAKDVSSELPEMGNAIARVLNTFEGKMHGEQPVHPAVVAVVTAAKRTQLAVGNTLAQLGPAFRAMHARDVERVEAPRPNEAGWNVPGRRGGRP